MAAIEEVMTQKQPLVARHLFLLFWLACAPAPGLTAMAQEDGPKFNLTRSASVADQFDLIISDGEERVVSGSFTKAQLEIFRQVMAEARKFAMTEEEVGKGSAKTTRIASNSQPSLIVDVAKLDDQSQFFITFTTEIGHITVKAGRVQRGIRREDGLFFRLLSRLESLLPQAHGRTT
jgi:hypothetical protein